MTTTLTCILATVVALAAAGTPLPARDIRTPAGTPAEPRAARRVVIHETTGPMKTHAYLLYDAGSREAALFDVGGPIETLVTAIDRRGLDLKYMLSTHGHADHVWGMPAVRARFPGVTWCIARAEFEDMSHYARWRSAMPPEDAAKLKAAMERDATLAATMDFDFSQLGAPDIFVEDDQVLNLGTLEIRAIHCPGHSRGSMCYQVGDVLFSGDVLMYRHVGRTDLPGAGGPEAMQSSVRHLFTALQDETTVYPGHGEFTEIGIEKLHNRVVLAAPAVP